MSIPHPTPTRPNFKKLPEYQVWSSMKNRCYNRKSKPFRNYGGRGITVCDRWLGSFANFLADMGSRPSPKHSLDRIDNSQGYSPANCKWATRIEQARNKRNNLLLAFNGKTLCLSEWAEITGLKKSTIQKRLRRWRWSVELALTTPV